jgi:hypothetical protein
MRIKKHPPSRNEYVRAGSVWVRNFLKPDVLGLDLNDLYNSLDYNTIVLNETRNATLNHPRIADEHVRFDRCVIVSDGRSFEERQSFFAELPPNVMVLAVNHALAKWKLATGPTRRVINLFVVNNPYAECLGYLPKATKYFPSCVASTRTCHDFVKQYKGNVYFYAPSPNQRFGASPHHSYTIDDYRNPVCAALGLASRFGAKRVMFVCCDESFDVERPAAVRLSNGLWTYPQHVVSQQILDANLFWMKSREDMRIADYSEGPELQHAEYISNDQAGLEFVLGE